MNTEFFVHFNGREFGPYTREQLLRSIKAGTYRGALARGASGEWFPVEKLRQHENGGVSEKLGLPALIFCFFLGGFGGHLFYVGRIGRGIATALAPLIAFPVFELFKDTEQWDRNQGIGTAIAGTAILYVIVMGFWVLGDLIRICSGKFRDAHGCVIKHWSALK